MSAAETLRRAAALMRERAEAATPGPWMSRRGPGEHVIADRGALYRVADTNSREDRRHITSWHPAVAVAVADWLDDEATRRPNYINSLALAVANTYLSEET